MSQKKNKALPIIIAACMFIPLIIAIVACNSVNPYDLSASTIESILLETPDGVSTGPFTDKESLSIYSEITKKSVGVDSAILSTYNYTEDDAYKVTFAEKTKESSVYKLYLSEDKTKCLYVSPDGKYFKINEKTAEKLLQRSEFSSANTSANLPSVTAAGLEDPKTIVPSSVAWNYLDVTGAVQQYNKPETAVDNPIIKFDTDENSLKFGFDKEPDKIKLKITNEAGEIKHDDLYEKLDSNSLISYNHDEALSVVATIEWHEKEGVTFWGSAEYKFTLLYDILPTYRIVDTKALPTGEFTVLRMSDFNDNEHLFIESDIGIPSEVNVYDAIDREGKSIKIALIPYGADLETGDYNLVACTEAGQKQTVSIKVRRSVPDPQTGIILDTIRHKNLENTLTKESLEEFNKLVTDLTKNSANEQLYEGKFVYPTGSSKVVSGGGSFGMKREFADGTISYTSMGNDLSASAGQEIVAANSGKVVYAGSTTLLGNTIIVDHGFSILTYYGNLDSVSVKVGDSVIKGETVLGKAGSTGFACAKDGGKGISTTMCHFAASMNTVFIAPKSIVNGIYF